jgi:hypothetical protein
MDLWICSLELCPLDQCSENIQTNTNIFNLHLLVYILKSANCYTELRKYFTPLQHLGRRPKQPGETGYQAILLNQIISVYSYFKVTYCHTKCITSYILQTLTSERF